MSYVPHTCLDDASYWQEGDEFYTVTNNEFVESADLLPGETAPDLDDLEEIPVRLLDDFTIYDWDTLRLVPITQLLDSRPGVHYGASGLVRPWVDDSVDEDSDDDDSTTPMVIKLSPILELNVHDFSPSNRSLDV
jgi:DNA (cytosine-5)-methyltransferase 1